jgi:hypothetical protein
VSTQTPIPDSPPVNILPVDPSSPPREAERRRIERRKSYGPILDFLKNTCKKVEDEDEQANLKIRAQQNKCQAYYDDRQYGKINDRTGEWEDTPYDPNYFRPIDNKYKEQVDKLQMEMARSSVDLNVEAVDQTDSAKREAAEFLKSRIDANRKRLFTQRPEFILSENMSLLLKTITYRYTYFDRNAEDGPKERRPKFAPTSIGEERSLTVCAVCREPRTDSRIETTDPLNDELPHPCRNCGSQSVKTLTTSPVELTLPNGEEEVPAGLVRCVHADPTMVKVSLNARMMDIKSSPYLIWTQMVERGKLEKMFPNNVIPSSGNDSDRQAEYRRENETAVSNSSDSSSSVEVRGGEQFEKLKFKLIWLDRWIYEDYQHDQPQKLPNGKILPPNTPLGPFVPEGMCLAVVNNTPLMAWNEDKNKKWSVRVYGLREHALHGAGTNALLPIQLTLNDLLGYRIANVYYNTFRREFIRQGAISGDQLPKLTEVGVINNVDEGANLVGNAYGQAPPMPLPPEVANLSEEQRGSLQEQAGTSSMSTVGTSAQQEGLGTATGIAYMRDQAVGRMGPNLMLGAAQEVETAFQIGEHEQNNYSRQQLLAFAGLRPGKPAGNLGYTEAGVDAFINSDIRADFLITPTPGSWMPVTEQEKKADALAMANVSGKVENPEVLANIAKVLKQPMQVGGFNATQREAARRIEEFGKVVQLLTSRGYAEATPEMAQVVLQSATNAQISVEMDNHQAHRDFLADWWVSDEARNAPPLLKLVVETRSIEHKDAMVQSAQDANSRAIETKIPEKVAEVASNQIDAEQQQAMASQQAEAQMEQAGVQQAMEQQAAQGELEKKAVENELNAQDREHQLTIDMVDREHEAAMNPQSQ